ncbi:NADH-quinone oxidoreductase subunit K [bacterium]|jgi:NADH:ubiquinone oxidoreductase subunit K|nr:NADH-quinone oxidoreductase subunit K [bacterium]
MITIAALLGGLGLVCVLYRKTILGLLVGLQLLGLSASLMLVLSGVASHVPNEGHLFGLFITLSQIGQLVVGYALAVRIFYLKKRTSVEDVRSLKN